jgi:hypothetical protein
MPCLSTLLDFISLIFKYHFSQKMLDEPKKLLIVIQMYRRKGKLRNLGVYSFKPTKQL